MVFNINCEEWNLDKAHSAIMFEVNHIFSATRGHFSDFNSDIVFNPNDLKNSRINFTVKTASIHTSIQKRDNHLKSVDFFNTGQYPKMKFKSEEIKHISGNKYIVKGKMTIKDTTKDLIIEGYFLDPKKHPFKKGIMVAGFETKFTLNRLDYHVGSGKYYKMGVVSNKIQIFISIEVIAKEPYSAKGPGIMNIGPLFRDYLLPC